jgi:phosphoribosyl 1,2-cyclic phosphodiesterase
MFIKCYGARGSIPVSGPEYNKYGGDTTCLEIRGRNDEIIIVDAGTGIRRLGEKLLKEKRLEYHILFTHSHIDHIIGFPFFKPVYDERCRIHMTGCPTTQGNIGLILSKTMSAPTFPVRFDELKAKIDYSSECSERACIDSIEIFPINLSHPNSGMGYKFVEEGKSFVFLTDNELRYRHRNGVDFDGYKEFARGADLLIHDAEYTEEEYEVKKTWGHSTVFQALELALKAGAKSLGLFHHNQNRSDAELDAIVQECRNHIRTQKAEMTCFALTQETEIFL